jgi:hypothetical protein
MKIEPFRIFGTVLKDQIKNFHSMKVKKYNLLSQNKFPSHQFFPNKKTYQKVQRNKKWQKISLAT